jgi:peptidoglycan/LPS O-acetylase OafA/YrhL
LSTPAAATERNRQPGIDAARVIATGLVVLHHTAITYGAIGGWFYKEVPNDRSLSSLLLVFFCTLNQAWFMGFFFLLAGYFTTPALRARGGPRFLRDRLLRLGLPLLLFGFVLGPATIALARSAGGADFGTTLLKLWSQGEFEKGPLWFAWALLIFAVLTVPLQRWLGEARAAPSDAVLLTAALVTGLTAFLLRLRWPVGTEVGGLQIGYFASYVALYVAGLLAAPGSWPAHAPETQVRRWRRVAWLALPVLPVVALLGGRWFGLQGRAEGGFSVLALVYAMWEPFVAWGVMLALLQFTRRHFAAPSPLWQRLARRAFAVYVIHPPVVVGVALAWRAVVAPTLLKFAVTGAVAVLVCYGLAGLLLRVPGLRRIL